MTDKLAETVRAIIGAAINKSHAGDTLDQWAKTSADMLREKFEVTEKPAPDPVGEMASILYREYWSYVRIEHRERSDMEGFRGMARHVLKLRDQAWNEGVEYASMYLHKQALHNQADAVSRLKRQVQP